MEFNKDAKSKLYSQRAISIATFFGGPLAAGILMQQNFINTGNELYGKHALSLGIVTTVLIFFGIYFTPDHFFEFFPVEIVPIIYTALIYFIVDWTFGGQLKQHIVSGGELYSAWKAAGVGFLSSIPVVLLFLALIYMEPEPFDAETYQKGITEFINNEKKALAIVELLEKGEFEKARVEIHETGIPLWIRNIEIVNSLNAIESIPEELLEQNQKLIEYCQLRLKEFSSIEKTISENSDKYELDLTLARRGLEEIVKEVEK